MRNRFLKIKHSNSKIIAIFVVLLFAMAYACQEDMHDVCMEEGDTLTIEDARWWYDTYKGNTVAV